MKNLTLLKYCFFCLTVFFAVNVWGNSENNSNHINYMDCPELFTPSCSPPAVCAGQPFDLLVGITDLEGGVLQWHDEMGNPVSNTEDIILNLDYNQCNGAQYGFYATYTPADPACSLVTTEMAYVTVYPQIAATITNQGCAVSLDNYCENFEVTWTDGQGNTGMGDHYTVSGAGDGTVTFTMQNAAAPAPCNTQEFATNYSCVLPCPIIGTPTASATTVCFGEPVDLDVEVENLDGGTLVWYDTNGVQMGQGSNIDLGISLCSPGNPGFYATYYPATASCEPVSSSIIYIEIYPQITADVVVNECLVSLDNYCEDFTVTWQDSNGNSGTGDTYNAQAGDNGTISFILTNPDAPAACQQNAFESPFGCPAAATVVCPEFVSVASSMEGTCNYQTFALSAQLVNDGAGGTLTWAQSNGVPVEDPNNVLLVNENCTTIQYGFVATFTPSDPSCEPITSETVFVNVYPQLNGVMVENGCTVELTNVCDEFVVTWTSNAGKPGDGTFFEGVPGETGFVEFTIYNPNATDGPFVCQIMTTSGDYDCTEVACPSISSPACQPAVICNGESFGLVLSTNNLDGGTLNWYDENDNLISNPDEIFVSADACQSGTYGYYAVYNPNTFGCEPIQTELAYVTVHPQIDAEVSGGTCTVSLSNSCADHQVTWTDNLGNNGTGNTYLPAAGESGSVSFTVTNTAAAGASCYSETLSTNFACGSDEIFDLALTKTLSVGQDSTVSPGDLVSFTMTVYNQGTVPAHNIFVTDYIPTGLILADSDWTDYGAFATTILGGTLAPGASQNIEITFMVGDVPAQCIENLAEISSAKDPNGVSQGDIDSSPDYDRNNDGEQVNDATTDPNDEDDFDGEMIYIIDCPEFSVVTVSSQDICSGSSIELSAGIIGDDTGTLTWYYTDGTVIADPSNLVLTNETCETQAYQVYASYVPTDETCPTLTSETFIILVYPNVFGTIESDGCTMELVGACPNFTVTYSTTTNKDGTGTTYTAQPGEAGNITYTIYNEGAPDAPIACQVYTTSEPFECSECPSLANPMASDNYICSGESVSLSVDVINEDGGALAWFNVNGAIITDPSTVVLTNTACTTITYQFYPQYVSSSDACETATTEPVIVQVFPTITATVQEEECSVFLTNLNDCEDYEITWQDNLGNSGTGMAYNATTGTNGTVSFTVTNTADNVPANCQSASFTGAFDCAEEIFCTSLFNPQTIPNIICSGQTFDLSVGINNGDGGTIQWFNTNGEQVNDPNDILIEVDGCNSSSFGYYATYTPANDECESVTTETVFVTIYPQISAVATTNDCQISLTGVCPNYDVTWMDNFGTNGSGLSYMAAQGTEGTVTFTVTGTDGAPAGCTSSIFTAEYECAEPTVCPDLFDPQTIPPVICDGENFNLSVGLVNADGGLLQWYDLSGNAINNPNDVNVAFEGCDGATFGYYAVYTPENPDCEPITSETTFIQVFPGVTANTTVNECNVVLTDICPNFDVTWSDTNGGMGTGTIFNAAAGTSGTVTYTVTNTAAPADCQSGDFTANYVCAEDIICPNNLVPAIDQNVICSGSSISLSSTIDNADDGTLVWYDLQGNTVANPANVVLTNTGCDVANYGFYAIYTPSNSNCNTITSAVVSTMVYPQLEANAETDGCTVSLTDFCPNLQLTWTDNLGNTGTGPVYVGSPGTSGTVSFELTNPSAPAACQSATASANFSCASNDVFDLALIKTLGPNQVSTVAPGDLVTFAIYVYNQGTVAANNITITDYIPAGLILNDSNWSGNGSTATTTLAGPIQPGGSTTVFISFNVDANANAGNLTNFAEISEAYDEDGNLGNDIDSTPDNDNGNDGTPVDNAINDSNDEDDHDPVNLTISIPTPCPTIGSVSISDNDICSGGSVNLSATINNDDGGQLFWYTSQGVQVTNPSNIVLTNTSCSPSVYGYYVYYIPANSAQCGGISSTVVSVTVHPEVNATVVENTCQVYVSSSCNYNISWTDNLGGSGTGSTYNASQGTSGTVTFTVGGSNGCGSTTLSGNFNCAPAVTCPSFNTVSASSTTICSGQSISLSATLNNQVDGQLSWYDMQGNPVSNPSNIVLTNTGCTTAGYGFYAYFVPTDTQCSPFSSTVVNISVYPDVTAQVVNNGCSVYLSGTCTNYNVTWTDNLGNNGSGSNYNAAEGTNGSVTFYLNNPDAPAGCQSGTVTGNFNCASSSVFDLALVKTLGSNQSSTVSTGETVTFSVYIYNQGTVPAYNVGIVDYIPTGLSLADANWSLNGSTASTTIPGPIQPGSGTLVPISFTVNSGATAGNLTNYAEITSATDGSGTPQADIDSTPDANNNNDGTPADNAINNPNDEDDHDLAQINVSQAVSCPTFGTISTNVGSICSGQSISLFADVNGADGGQLFWYDLQGSPVADPANVVLTNTGCMTAGYGFYAYYVPANSQCGSFTSTVVNVSVYPAVNATITSSANGCTVSVANYCTNFNVSWTDNLGNSGTGSTYMAGANTSGTVSFNVSNPNAPGGCSAATVTGNFSCGGGPIGTCPSFADVSCSPQSVCGSGLVDLGGSVNNPDGGTITWYDVEGNLISNPSSIQISNTGCEPVVFGYYAVYTPANGQCAPVSSTVVSTVVYPSPSVTASVIESDCSVYVSSACNYNITWTDNLGNSGSGGTYNATPGTSGTVTFQVGNTDAPISCLGATLSGNFNCAGGPVGTCPSFGTPTASSAGTSTASGALVVCNGATISLNSDLNNGDGGQIQWYQLDGTTVANPANVVVNATQCGGQTLGFYAAYYPTNASCSVITSTAVYVTAYPSISGELVNSADGCTVTLINACENLLVTWADNSGNTGSGNVYTATSGTAGSVTFTLTQADNAPATCGSLQLTSTYQCAGGSTGTPCDTMYYCTEPGVAINICPDPCSITGAWTIDDVATDCGCIPEIGPNCFEYTPYVQDGGSETIVITVCNATFCETVPVVISVDEDCGNDAPDTMDDVYSIDLNAAATFDVVANDSDPDGDAVYICAYEQALNGTIDLVNGQIYYVPNNNFVGTDYFTYTLCDGNQGSTDANVYVNVNPQGQGLTAGNDELVVISNETVSLNVLSNDTYPTSCTPNVVILTTPSTGSIMADNQGFIHYSPDPFADAGYDSFTYQICCGTNCATATVDMFLVESRECPGLEIPNGFSPNGDGTNEHFRIDDLETCFTDHEKELLIFDRNGEMIYERKDYDNGFAWNGKYENQSNVRVPEGTYFYILKISKGNSIIEKTGSIRVQF